MRLSSHAQRLAQKDLLSGFKKGFSVLATEPPPPMTGFDPTVCFQVNVFGGLTESSNTCHGDINLGITSTAQFNVSSEHVIEVPVGDSMVFEAYGLDGMSGACTSLASVTSQSGFTAESFFRVGTESVGQNPGDTITIDVGFEKNTIGKNCGTGAYQFFGDDWSYPDGNLGSTADWTPSGTIVVLNSALDLFNFSNSFNQATLNHAVDRTKNVRISADITYNNVSSGGPEIILGLTDSGGTNFIGCRFHYFMGPPDNIAFAAGGSASPNLTGLTSGSNFSMTTNHRLVCVIENNGASVDVTARGFDPSSALLGTDEVGTTSNDPTVKFPYFFHDGNGCDFASGSFVTNFMVEQAVGSGL